MPRVFIDFETRSELDLREVGAAVYARHPSTEVLCMAVGFDDPEGDVGLWVPGEPLPVFCKSPGQWTITAHNAAFEYQIWNNVCVKKYGFEVISVKQLECTAARCAALSLPRALEDAARVLKLAKLKDMTGKRVMMKLAKPRKPTKNNPETWHNSPTDFEVLYDYCKNDVVVERLIHEATPALPRAEQRIYQLDQLINNRGIPIDLDFVQAAIRMTQEHAADLCRRLTLLTDAKVSSGRQALALVEWLNSKGLNIGDVKAATITEQLTRDDLPAKVREVLEIRQELARSSTAKYQSMLDRANEDGRIREAHLYHGANTGRWAGRGVQFQNMPRGSLNAEEIEPCIDDVMTGEPGNISVLWDSVSETLAGLLRSAVKAPPGRRLIVCDFAAIEARVLAWLANETWLLKAFRDGADIYKEMAAEIYNVPVDKVTKEQRQVGKIAILGLGYGMGAGKFLATCHKFGSFVEHKFAERVVKIYREKNSRIKWFWYGTFDAAIQSVIRDRKVTAGRITFDGDDRWLYCRLPSGRELAYFHPTTPKEPSPSGMKPVLKYWGVDSYTRQWTLQSTYGGKLVENVVQAVARDLLVNGMQRLEEAGWPVIFHVHDEIVVEVPADRVDVERVESLMCTLPTWAKGLPLAAEGFSCERYRK